VRFHRQIPHTETKRIREMPWRRAVLSGIHMLADGDRTAGSGGSIRTSAWRHQKSSIELIRKLQKPSKYPYCFGVTMEAFIELRFDVYLLSLVDGAIHAWEAGESIV
jgi:hypothetical protein